MSRETKTKTRMQEARELAELRAAKVASSRQVPACARAICSRPTEG